MATQTSNLGLTKPAYSETADIADINNNMDKVDAAVHGVQNGMAILANGNVHSAVTSGQYVYVRNHGTLAEGLYTATTNISTNATLSTSNLTAVPNNGALNTLRDDVTSLNSNFIRSVVQGKIADSSSGNFNGLGCATVLLFPNHKAVITYSYKLTDESADNSNFSYGLNSQLLRELDTSLPNITPVAGGKWRCYKNDGTLLFSLLGYGTRHEINGTRWTLGRLYNTSGSTGPWSANELKTGYYIEGICLATY